MRPALDALGDDAAELFAILAPWGQAIRDAKGYPASGPHDLADAGRRHRRPERRVASRPMEHVRWLAEPTLRNPAVLFAFTGWNDAGDAASSSVRALVERWDATAIAEIDPEPFTDFATIRPHVRINDGRRSIVWPTVGVWSASVPGGDVMLVLGPEPSLRWKLFCSSSSASPRRLARPMAVSMGALLADVPHSRPVQIIGTASDPELIDRYDLQRSRYEGPTGIVGVLHDAMSTAGIPTASLWAAVPAVRRPDPVPEGRPRPGRAGLPADRQPGAGRRLRQRRRRVRRPGRRPDRRRRRPRRVRQPARVDRSSTTTTTSRRARSRSTTASTRRRSTPTSSSPRSSSSSATDAVVRATNQ